MNSVRFRMQLALALALVCHSLAPLHARSAELPTGLPEHDCLARHVTEGRELNQRRRPVYATWAGRIGQSRIDSIAVSTILIASELFSMRDARQIDRDAKEFQQKGIRIVCDDLAPIPDAGPDPICPKDEGDCFVPIKGTQIPNEAQSVIEIPALVTEKPQGRWTARIKESYEADVRSNGGTIFPRTLETSREILRVMDEVPRFLCIGRHLVESLIRIAAVAPGYEAQRIEKGMKRSTLLISRRLIESHIKLLGTTGEAFGLDGLDTRAAVFQAEGIPLICNDVPPISDPGRP